MAAVSPLPPASGQYAVTCDDDGHVIHWNLSDPAHPKIVGNKPFDGIADNPKLSFVTVSPILSGDATVLAAGFDGYVWILSLKNRQLTGAQQFKDHQGSEVWAVAISPNGQQAVSSTNSGEIRVWDVGSASTLASTTPIGEPVNSLALIPSDAAGNINLFLAGFGNGQMYVMHYDSSKNIITYVDPPFDHGDAMPVNSIAVFKDPTAVTTVYKAITGSFDSIVRIWDLTQPGKAPTTFPTTVMHSHFIWRVAASGDGNTFASVGEDKRLYIFDASGNLKTPTNNPPQFSDGIMGVAFLDNSSLVATTNEWDGVLGRSEVVVVKF